MRKQFSLSLAATLVSAATAFAQFEGILEMKTSIITADGSERGGGTMKVAVSKAGSRTEMNMQAGPGMTMNMVMLKKNDMPDVVYRINDANKSYTEIKIPKPAPGTESPDKEAWTVEKLGQEKILGYNTHHIIAKPKSGPGQPMEMWVAKDFLDYETYSKLQVHGGSLAGTGLAKALKDAGTEGMPLKAVVNSPEGKMTMEVVKADKKTLPASTFEIPAGYTKSAGGIMDGLSGPGAEARKAQIEEAQKKMKEQMKNLTPEQQEMIEKMLKQRGIQPQQ